MEITKFNIRLETINDALREYLLSKFKEPEIGQAGKSASQVLLETYKNDTAVDFMVDKGAIAVSLAKNPRKKVFIEMDSSEAGDLFGTLLAKHNPNLTYKNVNKMVTNLLKQNYSEYFVRAFQESANLVILGRESTKLRTNLIGSIIDSFKASVASLNRAARNLGSTNSLMKLVGKIQHVRSVDNLIKMTNTALDQFNKAIPSTATDTIREISAKKAIELINGSRTKEELRKVLDPLIEYGTGFTENRNFSIQSIRSGESSKKLTEIFGSNFTAQVQLALITKERSFGMKAVRVL